MCIISINNDGYMTQGYTQVTQITRYEPLPKKVFLMTHELRPEYQAPRNFSIKFKSHQVYK